MTVYVVQQPVPNKHGWTPNLTSATNFGALKFIFNGGEHIYSLTDDKLQKAQKVLKQFDPDTDYVLWTGTGDPAALIVVCFSLALLGFQSINFLYWNRKKTNGQRDYENGFYVPINFDLSKFTPESNQKKDN